VLTRLINVIYKAVRARRNPRTAVATEIATEPPVKARERAL